jgi:two-component system KDP operon response regulator KdpE
MVKSTITKLPASILVVDDDSQIRRAFRTILASQGCKVIEARDCEEAIEEVKASCPDLVLLDINMPGTDGIETCRRIREFSDIAVIMVTVRAEEKDKVAALDAGANDYIVKPFGTPELLARIRAVARRAPAMEGTMPAFNSQDLSIDFERRRVVSHGQPVHLTPTEFDLLKYLVSNQGKLVPYSNFLRLLWGPEHADDRELLWFFIGQLRKKIEPHPEQPRYIHTEPSVGYRFDPDHAMATKART